MLDKVGNFTTNYNTGNINTVKKSQVISNPNNGVSFKANTASANLIEQYLNNLSGTNSINIAKNNEKITPSGVDNYNNYTEFDDFGNEIINVSYSKENNSTVQNVKIKSPSGITTERITKNSEDTKSLNLVIKDKNGNILLNREKSYKKIDNDKAQTIVNGDVYNISGLNSNVITVEHNGETVVLDLNKMLIDNVADEDPDSNSLPKRKITDEEKEKLFDKIKALNGDDLYRLSKSVEKIQYFSGMDSFFNHRNKALLLQTKDIFGLDITNHELGHAYNHVNENPDNKGSMLSNRKRFEEIRQQATTLYLNNKTSTANDARFYGKFLDTKYCMERGNYETIEATNRNLQDEMFAESYNLLNTTNIINFDEGIGCPGRMLSMMKYMPEIMVEVNKDIT